MSGEEKKEEEGGGGGRRHFSHDQGGIGKKNFCLDIPGQHAPIRSLFPLFSSSAFFPKGYPLKRQFRTHTSFLIMPNLLLSLLSLLSLLTTNTHAGPLLTSPPATASHLLLDHSLTRARTTTPSTISATSTLLDLDTPPPSTLSIGTALGARNNVVSQGTTLPPWNVAGDTSLATDLPSFQSTITFYVTDTSDQNEHSIINVETQQGDLLSAETIVSQRDVSTSNVGRIDVVLHCKRAGRSHVQLTVGLSSTTTTTTTTTTTKTNSKVVFRFKKFCSQELRPALNIGTSPMTSKDIVHSGQIQPAYVSSSNSAFRGQKNGTIVQLSLVIEQLELLGVSALGKFCNNNNNNNKRKE